jgi:undecaprenyl diphosphate synthase
MEPRDVPTGGHEGFADDPSALAALARLRVRNPEADPLSHLPDVHPARIPRHIAIIMDGNGRWARARGLPRELGHKEGAKTVQRVVEECDALGVEVLTLYSFSLENWKRPRPEVDALMQLCLAYLNSEEEQLVEKGIRFRVIGRREGLPPQVLDAIDRVSEATRAGQRGALCLAINYGGRAEIADAAAALAADIQAGRLSSSEVDEQSLAAKLYTAGLPDPDLLIRTAGELRVSNFLLWQISYAELHVTSVLWPDFGAADLRCAIRDYARRTRRFGALDEEAP